MTGQEDFLEALIGKLDKQGIAYMLSGSVSSSLHGQPRATKDRRSEQQFRDALGVALVQWRRLDKDYLHKWAGQLHIEGQLKQLVEQAAEVLEEQEESGDG